MVVVIPPNGNATMENIMVIVRDWVPKIIKDVINLLRFYVLIEKERLKYVFSFWLSRLKILLKELNAVIGFLLLL